MTTPEQRTRALNETREFLLELTLGAGARESSERWARRHDTARKLLHHFPLSDEVMWIERLLEIRSPAETVPLGHRFRLGGARLAAAVRAAVVGTFGMVMLFFATRDVSLSKPRVPSMPSNDLDVSNLLLRTVYLDPKLDEAIRLEAFRDRTSKMRLINRYLSAGMAVHGHDPALGDAWHRPGELPVLLQRFCVFHERLLAATDDAERGRVVSEYLASELDSERAPPASE